MAIFVLGAGLFTADPLAAAPVGIDIPAGKLRDALDALSSQAHISVAVVGRMPSLPTPSVRGRMEPDEALSRLMAGSRWQARKVGPATWQLVPVRPPPARQKIMPRQDIQGSQDIIVTALKRDQFLLQAPAAISVIGGERFGAGSTARGSSDIAEQVGSVFATSLGPGLERLFLRGVADSPFNGPTQSTVGLFLDDSRINYALPDPDLRMVDIDRVEVLRGPQGTLYGTGNLGGIVRIVTNRPELDQFGGSLAAEGLSTAHGGMGGGLEGVANIPLAHGKLALRLAAYTDTSGGWIDDPSRGISDINRVNRSGGRINVRWKPGGGDWTIDLSIIAQDLQARDSQYAMSGLAHHTAIAEPHRNRFFLTRIEARGPIGGLDFLSTTAIESNRVDSRLDAGTVASGLGLTPPLAYDERRDVYLVSQEFRLSDPRDARKWVVGVSIINAINVTRSLFVPASGPVASARSMADERLEAAAFAEAVQPLGSGFDFTLGLRAFSSQSVDDPRQPIAKVKPDIAFTPSATLSWHPSQRQLFWLRYASAIRPGGSGRDGSGTSITFKSDDLKSLELGSRSTLLDGHIIVNATAFLLDWRNLQSDRIGLDGLVTTVNIDDATNYGVEFNAHAKWSDFTAEASLIRQHGRLKTLDPVSGIHPQLPVLPDISASGRIAWDSRIGDFDVGAHLALNFWGAFRLGFDPTFQQDVPSRVLLGAGALIGRDSWRLSLNISNLLDSSSDSFAFGNPFTFRSIAQRTPVQPRTIGLRFERRF